MTFISSLLKHQALISLTFDVDSERCSGLYLFIFNQVYCQSVVLLFAAQLQHALYSTPAGFLIIRRCDVLLYSHARHMIIPYAHETQKKSAHATPPFIAARQKLGEGLVTDSLQFVEISFRFSRSSFCENVSSWNKEERLPAQVASDGTCQGKSSQLSKKFTRSLQYHTLAWLPEMGKALVRPVCYYPRGSGAHGVLRRWSFRKVSDREEDHSSAR